MSSTRSRFSHTRRRLLKSNPIFFSLTALALVLFFHHAVFAQQRSAAEELAVALAAAATPAERSALLEQEKKLASPELVKALLAEGDKLRDKAVYKHALEIYRLTLAIAETTGDGVSIANSLARVGMVYRAQGDYAEALDYFGQSLTLAEKIGDKSVTARTLNAIGNVYVFQGEHETALRYYERSLALLEELKNNQDISRSSIKRRASTRRLWKPPNAPPTSRGRSIAATFSGSRARHRATRTLR